MRLDDMTLTGLIDYENDTVTEDQEVLENYERFARRSVAIAARLVQSPVRVPQVAVPEVETSLCPTALKMALELHREIAETGTLDVPERPPFEDTSDPVVDMCAAILQEAIRPTSDFVEAGSRATYPEMGGMKVCTVKNIGRVSHRRDWTMIEPICDWVEKHLEKPLNIPEPTPEAIWQDVGFNSLTIPTPLFDAEIVTAHYLLEIGLFKLLKVRQYNDDMAACPASSCGPGFSAGITQDQLKLSASQGLALIGKPLPSCIRAIPKIVPASDTRCRVVCGVDVLSTAAMKALTKAPQSAIVDCTQSDNPGLSAVGLVKNNKAVNYYFERRTSHLDKDGLQVFGADHTKCDRTVAAHYCATSYAYLGELAGHQIDRDKINWALRTSVLVPTVFDGVRVDGRFCEASGDAATCHTNTIFNTLVHTAVFMRSIINNEETPPMLRKAIYSAYHGDFKSCWTIVNTLLSDHALVFFSDDGLVFHKDFGCVWNPKNWSKRLASISGLPVDEAKSHAGPVTGTVEFLGCELSYIGMTDVQTPLGTRQIGPWVLAPTPQRLAKQLCVMRGGSMYRVSERVSGILQSAASMMFTEPGPFWEAYNTATNWIEMEAEKLSVSRPAIWPTPELLTEIALGVVDLPEVTEQAGSACVCGEPASVSCPDCPFLVPLCGLHAAQHFGSTRHNAKIGACACGEDRFTQLAFTTTFTCTTCSPTAPKVVDGLITGRNSEVDTIGTIINWSGLKGYWRAMQQTLQIQQGAIKIFEKDYPDGVDTARPHKPGTRFRLFIKNAWRKCVVDREGNVRTSEGLVHGHFRALPLSVTPCCSRYLYDNLQSATYVQGPPGTGKTYTAVQAILNQPSSTILYCAASNNAVHETVSKLNEHGIYPRWLIPKLSSYDYPMQQLSPGSRVTVATAGCAAGSFDLVIIDECSLLPPSDVCHIAACGKAILLVGDHQQLAPVTEPPMVWGADFWLLDVVRDHVVLDKSYRFGPEVVALIASDYPNLQPADHETEVSWDDIENYKFDLGVQTLVMYNHELPRHPGAKTVDSSQGDTYENVDLLVYVNNAFTRSRPRVVVAVTRAKKRLRIFCCRDWRSTLLPSVEQQSDRTYCYADFEFAHCRDFGDSKFTLVICQAGLVGMDGREHNAYIKPAKLDNQKYTECRIPAMCSHCRSGVSTQKESPHVTLDKCLRFVRNYDTLVVYNGSNDIRALQRHMLPDGALCTCGRPAISSVYMTGGLLDVCANCERPGDSVLRIPLKFLEVRRPCSLQEAHGQLCPHTHGIPHDALTDARMTACLHYHDVGLGLPVPNTPDGFLAVPRLGAFSIGPFVMTERGCMRAAAPINQLLTHSKLAGPKDYRLQRLNCANKCMHCCDVDRRIVNWQERNKNWILQPLEEAQVLSKQFVTGIDSREGKLWLTLSVSPYAVPLNGDVSTALATAGACCGKPLPVSSVVKNLGIFASTVGHSSLPLAPTTGPFILTDDQTAKDGVVVSWQSLGPLSQPAYGAQFEINFRRTMSDSSACIPYWLTCRKGGEDVPLPHTHFSTGVLRCCIEGINYSYQDQEPPEKYAHIFIGDSRNNSHKIDGVHHATAEALQWTGSTYSLDYLLADVALRGTSKYRTTVVDLSIRDYVNLLEDWESLPTESKVVSVSLDYTTVRFMVWRNATAYPVSVQQQALVVPPNAWAEPLEPFDLQLSSLAKYVRVVDLASYVARNVKRPSRKQFTVHTPPDLKGLHLDTFLKDLNATPGSPPCLAMCDSVEEAKEVVESIVPGGHLILRTLPSPGVDQFTRYFGSYTRFYLPVEAEGSVSYVHFIGKLLSVRRETTDSDDIINGLRGRAEAVSTHASPAVPSMTACPTIPSSGVLYAPERVAQLTSEAKLYIID